MAKRVPLEAAQDRLREAHFFLHGLEMYYHFSEPFRWNLNAVIRALKEVPSLIRIELQNRPGFTPWFNARLTELSSDPLIGHLSKHRNFLVHQGMLRPRSTAFVGITEGRGLKLGFGLEIDPMRDSDAEMARVLRVIASHGDHFGLLQDDEDSLPCIKREWRLAEFGDENLVDVAARAWRAVGILLANAAQQIGTEGQPLDLDCRHDLNAVRIRVYDRDDLREGRVAGYQIAQSAA